MIFVGEEELGIKGFRCELNRGEIVELTVRSLFPNLTDEDIVTLREAIDHGIMIIRVPAVTCQYHGEETIPHTLQTLQRKLCWRGC